MSRSSRLRLLVLAGALGAAVVLWMTRETVLVGVARVLVAEDALQPVDVVVLSGAIPRAAAFEGSELYRAGHVRRALIVTWRPDPLTARVKALGIPQPSPNELIGEILERDGVPPAAIGVVPGDADGTESEIALVAGFVDQNRPASLMYVTARTHTARAKWLLARVVPKQVHLVVRASRFDRFSADGWWEDRDQARDLMAEYLRWCNSVFLSDGFRRSVLPRAAGSPGLDD